LKDGGLRDCYPVSDPNDFGACEQVGIDAAGSEVVHPEVDGAGYACAAYECKYRQATDGVGEGGNDAAVKGGPEGVSGQFGSTGDHHFGLTFVHGCHFHAEEGIERNVVFHEVLESFGVVCVHETSE